MNRKSEIATIMLMANITSKLGTNLTKNVNDFRRKLRKYLNKLEKHEKSIYAESFELASKAWAAANKPEHDNMSVASTLDSLYLLIDEVSWIKKKLFTSKQFTIVYSSIVHDRCEPLSLEVEQNSKAFIDDLVPLLGFEKRIGLKRLIYTIRQNSIIKKG